MCALAAHLDAGQLGAGPHVARSRDEVGSHPCELLTPLDRSGAREHEAGLTQDRDIANLSGKVEKLGQCLVRRHRRSTLSDCSGPDDYVWREARQQGHSSPGRGAS